MVERDKTMSTRQATDDTRIESIRIGPDDPRYLAVVDKRFNKRFRARPDYVRLVSSTDQVISAVEEAVREGRRLVVTSGGHCLEGFVSDPEVRVIVDVSPMKRVYYDAERRAVAVEAGATVGETFRALFEKWGIVIPLGEYPEIGMGGHVAGGAFGFLCRQLGLAADYLYAVEVVTVDESGRASSVVATREASDPHRDLWWAHTGGGAGNFGVVTRYWFRSPGASGENPATLLPRAPQSITTFRVEWPWSDIDRPSFLRLLKNHGIWCEQNSEADSPNASLWTLFEIHRKQFGKIIIRGVSTAGAAADGQIDDHLAALAEGVGAPQRRELERMSWLEFALNPFPDLFATPPGGVSVKVKDALLKKRFTDHQIAVAYDYVTRTDHDVMGGMLGLATYGGRINTVAPDATASAQRDSILDIACSTGWLDPREEAKNLTWVRAFYRDLFAESGGVPIPGESYDGTFINHPDTDLADPNLNPSGVPWHTLYYKGSYPRLQRIKARWDPRNVFRHALSIRVESGDRSEEPVVTKEKRDRPSIIAPPPLLAAVCVAAGFIAAHYRPFPLIRGASSILVVLGVTLFLTGAALIFFARQELVKHHEHPNPYKPTEAIVVGGIYRFTRNPIYAGFLIMVIAIGVGANNAWLLLSFVALFILLHFGVVKAEERYLSAKFGQMYDEYRRSARRWV